MPEMPKRKFTLIRDTREHKNHGFEFVVRDWVGAVVDRCLPTGDYAVEGLEAYCVADRKGAVSELSANLFDDRFERELVRMDAIAHPFVVCEFSFDLLNDFPRGSSVPVRRWRFLKAKGPSLVRRLTELSFAHPKVGWVFAGTRPAAQAFTRSLLKRTAETYGHTLGDA